jgi:glycosyltransferase involved in cell wall biosynthesis
MLMTSGIRVSVIMNAHNSTEFLYEAIASVLVQTVHDLEVVVWDNASTDRAEAIALGFNDPRIRYFYTHEKTALYQARCDAVGQARGRYSAFLDCDDVWAPNKLERQIAVLSGPGIVASCTDYESFNEGQPDEREYFRAYTSDVVTLRDALLPYRVGMSCLIVRTSVLHASLPEPAPDWFFIEDLDIVSRVLLHGDLACVHEPLMRYRFHGNNASRDRSAFVRETNEWVADLATRPMDSSTARSLAHYYRTQAVRTQVIELLKAGRRREALRAWTRMPMSLTKAKWAIGLIAPRSLTARYS